MLVTFKNRITNLLKDNILKASDFAIDSAFRKKIVTGSQDVVDVCRDVCNCPNAEMVVAARRCKFLNKSLVLKMCYVVRLLTLR